MKIDHINDEFVEVVEGLAEDTGVVLNPGDDLRNGKRVKPR
ncbi:MAG: hypothetical protein V4475_00910 [Pseudomonadota bacterium]